MSVPYWTRWNRIEADYYLCEIEVQEGLRSKVYVRGDGSISTTFLRNEDAIAQVLAEAPAAIASLAPPMAQRGRFLPTLRMSGIIARHRSVCAATGEIIEPGDVIPYDDIGWIKVQDGHDAPPF